MKINSLSAELTYKQSRINLKHLKPVAFSEGNEISYGSHNKVALTSDTKLFNAIPLFLTMHTTGKPSIIQRSSITSNDVNTIAKQETSPGIYACVPGTR